MPIGFASAMGPTFQLPFPTPPLQHMLTAFPLAILGFDPSSFSGALIAGSICFALAFVLTVLVRRTARRLEHYLTDVTALGFISAFLQVFIWLFAFIAFAHVVPELRSLGSALLAGVSVMSLAVGIAAQNTLGNLIAGFSLVLSRTLRVGDHIRLGSSVGSISGTVRRISLSVTVLVDEDAKEVLVPNSVVMGSTVTRLSANPLRDTRKPPVA